MKSANFSYDNLQKYVAVSRETYLQLKMYIALLEKWQPTINLVSAHTMDDVWKRHIIDSAQLMNYIDAEESVVDLGSGAGFPGVMLAICGMKKMTLVESDARKVAFLREAARIANTAVTVIHNRAEEISYNDFSIITARAFAPLPRLLSLIKGTLKSHHKLLLLKGKSYKDEIIEARRDWSFEYEAVPSISDAEGTVLMIKNIRLMEAL